jgi:IS605 OrfB family transposase
MQKNGRKKTKMQLTVQFKLLPTDEQRSLLNSTMLEYIKTTNDIVNKYVCWDKLEALTSKHINADLPSALKVQAIQDARSIFVKSKKKSKLDSASKPTIPALKKPIAVWNNANHSFKGTSLSFPIWSNGKSKRILVKAVLTKHQTELLTNKIGTLRISVKSGKYIAQIAVDVSPAQSVGTIAMGVDLGLKIPAVAVTECGKVIFCGNGRENKYRKRKYCATRRRLGKQKKLKTILKLNNKEQRWMTDQDHKISRRLVNFAQKNKVAVIRLEKLSGIRQTARTSRKNAKNLHSWSFYRLANFIEYKATLQGIKVEYVNPEYTSQTCPACGTRNKANDRKYKCACGFKGHRDFVGAKNIILAPVIVGNRLSA